MTNNYKVRLLIVSKSIDGGTGTFVSSLLKLKKTDIKVTALEEPSFRAFKNREEIGFLNPKNFYPHKYGLSFKNVANLFRELFWLKYQIA